MSDSKQDGIESAANSNSGKQLVSSGGTCDEYGFVVPDEYVQAYRQHSAKIAPRRQEVKDQWNVLVKELKEQGLRLDGSVTSRAEAIEKFGEKTRSCRKLCRGPVIQGIPPDLRPFVWPLMCGVEKARAAKGEHVYPSLLQRCEGKDRNHELELDLDRTFPGHPLLDRESAHGADFKFDLWEISLCSIHLISPATDILRGRTARARADSFRPPDTPPPPFGQYSDVTRVRGASMRRCKG